MPAYARRISHTHLRLLLPPSQCTIAAHYANTYELYEYFHAHHHRRRRHSANACVFVMNDASSHSEQYSMTRQNYPRSSLA